MIRPSLARRNPRSLAAATAALLAFAWPVAPPAAAQSSGRAGGGTALDSLGDPVERVNEVMRSIRDEDRSEMLLIPALAAMDPPPGAVDSVRAAQLVDGSHPAWGAASGWAGAEPQQAALEAMKTVSEPRSRFLFALPYGEASAPAVAVEAGMYTSWGDPPLLAAAEHGHLDGLDGLERLVHVEATRLAADGKGYDAATLLTHWLRFCRSVADREFFEEKHWALTAMIGALDRLRDVVYVYPESIEDRELRDVIRGLEEREMGVDRIRLPSGDRLALLQAIRATFVARGGPDPATFGATLARLAASDRPMRLFGEAGRWQRIAEGHAGYYETADMAAAVFDDWELRWQVGPFDLLLDAPSEFQRLDRARFAIIAQLTKNLDTLFADRLSLRAALRGTRQSLGVVGFRKRFGSWPGNLFAIRPQFASEIDMDPYDPSGAEVYRYFVPMRDEPRSERELPKPHTMTVVGAGVGALGGGGSSALPLEKIIEWVMTPVRAQFGDDESVAQVEAILRPIYAQFPELLAEAATEGWLRSDVGEIVSVVAGQAGAGGDLRQAMRSIRHEQIDALEDFTGPVYDASRVDFAGRGLPPEARRVLEAMFRKMEEAFKEAEELGPDEVYSWEAYVPITDLAEFRTAVEAVARGEQPSLDDLRAIATQVIRINIQQDFGGGPVVLGESFTVELTDETFVLYSVGFNGTPDRAVTVGPGGNDILFWPPLLSLVRQQSAP